MPLPPLRGRGHREGARESPAVREEGSSVRAASACSRSEAVPGEGEISRKPLEASYSHEKIGKQPPPPPAASRSSYRQPKCIASVSCVWGARRVRGYPRPESPNPL